MSVHDTIGDIPRRPPPPLRRLLAPLRPRLAVAILVFFRVKSAPHSPGAAPSVARALASPLSLPVQPNKAGAKPSLQAAPSQYRRPAAPAGYNRIYFPCSRECRASQPAGRAYAALQPSVAQPPPATQARRGNEQPHGRSRRRPHRIPSRYRNHCCPSGTNPLYSAGETLSPLRSDTVEPPTQRSTERRRNTSHGRAKATMWQSATREGADDSIHTNYTPTQTLGRMCPPHVVRQISICHTNTHHHSDP